MSRVELINFSDFVNVLFVFILQSSILTRSHYIYNLHIARRSASLMQSFFFKSSKNRFDVKNVF